MLHFIATITERFPRDRRIRSFSLFACRSEKVTPSRDIITADFCLGREHLNQLRVALTGFRLSVWNHQQQRLFVLVEIGDIVGLLGHSTPVRLSSFGEVARSNQFVARTDVTVGVVAPAHGENSRAAEQHKQRERANDKHEFGIEFFSHESSTLRSDDRSGRGVAARLRLPLRPIGQALHNLWNEVRE